MDGKHNNLLGRFNQLLERHNQDIAKIRKEASNKLDNIMEMLKDMKKTSPPAPPTPYSDTHFQLPPPPYPQNGYPIPHGYPPQYHVPQMAVTPQPPAQGMAYYGPTQNNLNFSTHVPTTPTTPAQTQIETIDTTRSNTSSSNQSPLSTNSMEPPNKKANQNTSPNKDNPVSQQ